MSKNKVHSDIVQSDLYFEKEGSSPLDSVNKYSNQAFIKRHNTIYSNVINEVDELSQDGDQLENSTHDLCEVSEVSEEENVYTLEENLRDTRTIDMKSIKKLKTLNSSFDFEAFRKSDSVLKTYKEEAEDITSFRENKNFSNTQNRDLKV